MSASLATQQGKRARYSLSRLIKTKSSISEQHNFETEISQDLELNFGKTHFDYLIPPEVLGLRAISTDNTGSNLIATEQSDFFYHAPQPKSKVISLGGQLLTGLQDNYEIIGNEDPFQAYWVSEKSTISSSEPEVFKKTLKPQKLVATCTVTTEMYKQATDFSDRFLAEGLGRALWAEIDRAVLTGNGTTQPLGIASAQNVNSVVLGVDGGFLNWNAIVEMENLVTANNPDEKNLGYLINSNTASYLKKAEKVNGSGQYLLADQPLQPMDEFKVLNSRVCGVTNNLPSNLVKGTSNDLSMAVFGDWSTVVIGIFGAIALQVDPYSGDNFSRELVTLRMMALVDVGFLNPSLFTVVTDVKTQ